MLTVYRVEVYFRGNLKHDNHLWLEKKVVKCRVVKTGREYLYLSSTPEGVYPSSDPDKVPVSKCYSTLGDAQKAADEMADQLVGKLMGYVSKLKEPAKVIDRIPSK